MYKPTNEYVFDRVYDSVKTLVVSGELAEGERLNIEKLALKFDVSTSPVREVLNRLVAEDLIDATPKIGFFTKHISEIDVRDMLELNQILLSWSLEYAQQPQAIAALKELPLFSHGTGNASSDNPSSATGLVITTAALFTHIAAQSGNRKIIQIVQHINDRLFYLRLREYDLMEISADEMPRLIELCHQRNFKRLETALKAYHDLRSALLPNFLNRLRLALETGRK